jgi:hypothetical protein
VSTLPSWLEREAAARLAATEAARLLALADDWDDGAREAAVALARVAENHGLEPSALQLTLRGELRRGGVVEATVRTSVPLTWVPALGPVGRFTIVERHSERVDPYRSW